MSRKDALRQAHEHLRRSEQEKVNAKRDIAYWKNHIAELEAKPTLPEPDPTASFIAFTKMFEKYGTVYKYGALRVRGLWYVTGATGPNGVTWDALVDFIEKDNLLDVQYTQFLGRPQVITAS